MARYGQPLLLICAAFAVKSAALHVERYQRVSHAWSPRSISRRFFLATAALGSTSTVPAVSAAPTIRKEGQGRILATIPQPNDSLGIELYDVRIGTPSRTVAAVRSSRNPDLLPPGLIIDGSTSLEVTKRLKSEPYPTTIVFRNLAAAGDAIADDGKPIVTAYDALQLAIRQSSDLATDTSANPSTSSMQYGVQTLVKLDCPLKTRRNDVLEINYEAAMVGGADNTKIVYDASEFRGTGQPYQVVLGSGDILPGVDQGLYDMCPGEKRRLTIPPALAYGSKGNKMFRIPPNSSLEWTVSLVSINGMIRQGDNRTRDDAEGRE